MSGIKVVAYLVSCTQSLLLCDDISTEHLRFTDAGECRTRLPAIIHDEQERVGPNLVVMGRCRYVVDDPRSIDSLQVTYEASVSFDGAPRTPPEPLDSGIGPTTLSDEEFAELLRHFSADAERHPISAEEYERSLAPIDVGNRPSPNPADPTARSDSASPMPVLGEGRTDG